MPNPNEVLNLAIQCHQAGHLQQAKLGYQKLLQIDPNHPDALHLLGVISHQTGQSEIAIGLIQKAIQYNSNYAIYQHSLGLVLKDLGELDRAICCFRQAILLDSSRIEWHNDLGNSLKICGKNAEALQSYQIVLRNRPDADVHNNLGCCLLELNRWDEAEKHFHQSLVLAPDFTSALIGLGNVYKHKGKVSNAESAYRRSIELGRKDAELSLSILLLSVGRYSEGWRYFESRYDPGGEVVKPDLPFIHWQGESLAGKSLLICHEQGHGDQIQFVRFIPVLRNLGISRLTLICSAPLKPLFETLVGIDQVCTHNDSFGWHDYWTLLLSLPLHLGTTVESIPTTLPYINAKLDNVERWHHRLKVDGLKVGLVWKGSTDNSNDANRSLPNLAILTPLWTVTGVTFFSLQKGQGEDEVGSFQRKFPIVDLGADIQNFDDTAAIVSQLDLVISVDTAIAHIAGALNVSCWVMLESINTDWRWMNDRTDSPWYPNVLTLFRKNKGEEWEIIVGEVAKALKGWAKS